MHYDVVVVGGGAAGVAAAMAATRNGSRTLLVESGPFIGGELVSGLPIDGVMNVRGEWVVGGPGRELFQACDELGGYVGALFDWRTMWAVCLDPELFKLAIVQTVARSEIPLLLYTFAEDVVVDQQGRLTGVVVVNKNQRTLLTADVFVDCTGDGDLAVLAGAEWELGGQQGQLQPLTLLFRMSNVDFDPWLAFIRDHPDEFLGLGENPAIGKTAAEAAQAMYDSGLPFGHLSARGPLLSGAIERGEMYPCTAIFTWPTSLERRELGLNTTRLANVDATDTQALSQALATLTGQVLQCRRFVRQQLPGWRQAEISGVAARIGIRETRRILGEYVLQTEDVIEGRKFDDGVAKGAHHVDIHGSGTDQTRVPVKDGRSYDIPYGALVPKRLENVLLAGRCISSTREANGSARVMGTCLATGQAAGTAAALTLELGKRDVREVPIGTLRQALKDHQAVIDGTY